MSTRPSILREHRSLIGSTEDSRALEHLGKGAGSLFPWQSDSGGQVKWRCSRQASQDRGFFSDGAFILEALNLPGTLGLNSSERQTLDLSEGGQTPEVSRLVLRNCPAWVGVAMSVLE